MKRRDVIVIGGVGAIGGAVVIGDTLYASTDLALEPTDDETIVKHNGERIDTLAHPVSSVEDERALLGVSIPDRTTVQTVEVEVVWAIRQDGLWSGVTLELAVMGGGRANISSGVASAYRSSWERSPSESGDSTSTQRRYGYPSGTTAGRVTSLLTVLEGADSAEGLVELEARLSARPLGGSQLELTAPAELRYSLD